MKKYKLIKAFPGSPFVGDIAIYKEKYDYYHIDNNYHAPQPKELIEGFSEYWVKHLFDLPSGFPVFVGDTCWVYRKDQNDIVSTTFIDVDYKNILTPNVVFFDKEQALKHLENVNIKAKGKDVLKTRNITEDTILYIKGKTTPFGVQRFYYFRHEPYVGVYLGNNHYTIDEILTKTEYTKIVKKKKWYGVDILDWKLKEMEDCGLDMATDRICKWFETEKERDEYVKLNKKRFSMQDIILLMDTQGENG